MFLIILRNFYFSNFHNLAQNHPKFTSWGIAQDLLLMMGTLILMHPGLRNWRNRESSSYWRQLYELKYKGFDFSVTTCVRKWKTRIIFHAPIKMREDRSSWWNVVNKLKMTGTFTKKNCLDRSLISICFSIKVHFDWYQYWLVWKRISTDPYSILRQQYLEVGAHGGVVCEQGRCCKIQQL